MKPRATAIEQRLRDHIASECGQVSVPPQVATRILGAVEATRPRPNRARSGVPQVAMGMVFILLIAVGIAWMRTAQLSAAIVTGSWSSAPSMAVPRAYHTATLLPNGKVLVVGGRGLIAISAAWQRAGSAISSAELYDPKTRRWSSAGTLSTPRSAHTATLLTSGKVLVVGGIPTLPNASVPAGVDFLASAELYDPRTNSWSLAASMHIGRSAHTATLLADGRVLVAGGIVSSAEYAGGGSAIASAELYDPAANIWTVAAPMRSARWTHSATLLSDHRVLVVGGMDRLLDFPTGTAPTTGLDTAELFDPATDSWAPAPSMGSIRISPSATLLPNGRVLVVGDSGVNERTAEIYDPAAERWSPIPEPAAGRASHIAVLLRSGAVLIAGGLGETSAELYDWNRNLWKTAGSLAVIRSGATATILKNGQVLVAGGFGSGSNAWAGAELYDPLGSYQAGITRTGAHVLTGGIAPVVAVAGLLLALGLWLASRRRARRSEAGEIWID